MPEDISALVTNSQEEKISLTLVNLNENNIKNIIIQAGSMGEHSFGTIRYQISENSQFHEGVINNRYLIHAIGNSARESFEMLRRKGIGIEKKQEYLVGINRNDLYWYWI